MSAPTTSIAGTEELSQVTSILRSSQVQSGETGSSSKKSSTRVRFKIGSREVSPEPIPTVQTKEINTDKLQVSKQEFSDLDGMATELLNKIRPCKKSARNLTEAVASYCGYITSHESPSLAPYIKDLILLNLNMAYESKRVEEIYTVVHTISKRYLKLDPPTDMESFNDLESGLSNSFESMKFKVVGLITRSRCFSQDLQRCADTTKEQLNSNSDVEKKATESQDEDWAIIDRTTAEASESTPPSDRDIKTPSRLPSDGSGDALKDVQPGAPMLQENKTKSFSLQLEQVERDLRDLRSQLAIPYLTQVKVACAGWKEFSKKSQWTLDDLKRLVEAPEYSTAEPEVFEKF